MSGIALGAVQSSAHPDALSLFPNETAKDVKDHPYKYVGTIISTYVVIGVVDDSFLAFTARIR